SARTGEGSSSRTTTAGRLHAAELRRNVSGRPGGRRTAAETLLVAEAATPPGLASTRNGQEESMGLPVSLILIAAGAILAWGITDEPSGLNLDAIGVILMVVGIVGFVLTLLLWRSWWGPGYWTQSAYVEGAPARPWYYGGQW